MANTIFKVNSKIEIEVKHGQYQGIYCSRIEEIMDAGLEIAIPSKQGHLLPLPMGTRFWGKIAQNTSLYIFKTKITHVALMQKVPIWIIERPEIMEKVQRRSHVRMEVRLPASVQIHVENEKILSIEGKNYSAKELETKEWEAYIKDISGSGVKLITKLSIPEETNIALTFHLPEVGPFYTQAKVKRSHLINAELGIYWVGIQFVGLTERERDKIVRFIFKKQVEMRKRSLL